MSSYCCSLDVFMLAWNAWNAQVKHWNWISWSVCHKIWVLSGTWVFLGPTSWRQQSVRTQCAGCTLMLFIPSVAMVIYSGKMWWLRLTAWMSVCSHFRIHPRLCQRLSGNGRHTWSAKRPLMNLFKFYLSSSNRHTKPSVPGRNHVLWLCMTLLCLCSRWLTFCWRILLDCMHACLLLHYTCLAEAYLVNVFGDHIS